jgi:hypothetical protein
MSGGGAFVCSRIVLSRFMVVRPTNVPCSARAVVASTARNSSVRVLRLFSDTRSQGGEGAGRGDPNGTTTTSYDGASYSSGDSRFSSMQTTRRSTTAAPTEGYVSPYEKLFERMHANAPTILGTTDEYLEFEKQRLSKKLECGMPEHVLRYVTRSWGRVSREHS